MKNNVLRLYLFLSISVISQLISAQNFSRVPQFYPIAGVQNSSVIFADINGDDYSDLLISGLGRHYPPMTKLYINDGLGNFLEKANTPFDGVHYSAMAVTDVNGDSFSDIIISGQDQSSALPIKLYINDGLGNFTEMLGIPVLKIWKGTVVLEDLNGDNHPDMIVSGRTAFSKPTTKMFFNDGTGHFTEVKETHFIDVYDSSIAVKDVNGDRHPDVLIAGLNSAKVPITNLYMNNGKGSFSELAIPVFTGVSEGSVSLEDMNSDGYPDVLVSGIGSTYLAVTKLYVNDGAGNFKEKQENSFFKDFYYSFATIEDIDSDGSPDVLITGRKASGAQSTLLYMNDSQGNFVEKESNLVGIIKGAITTADVNNDDYPDVLIAGRSSSGDPITILYINDGVGNFSEKQESITGVYGGCITIADVNGDQHPDLFIAGQNNSLKEVMALYINDGAGNFTKVRRTPFKGNIKSISIADVNSDKFPDVLVTGWYNEGITKLYLNDGTGSFSELNDTPFVGVQHGSGVMADVNGDHHPDVLITGGDGDNLITKLYFNDGAGNFFEIKDTRFTGIDLSSIAVTDVNGDDYPDIFISGYNNDGNETMELYTNDSLGHFKIVNDTPFMGAANSIVVADINGDEFSDVLFAGISMGSNVIKFYTNDGRGHFTEVKDSPFEGMHDNSIAVGDLNNDNLPDIIVSGNNGANPILKVYMNEGDNHFLEILETPFSGLLGSTIAIDDINGDDRPDVLIAGETSTFIRVFEIFINKGK